MKANNWVTYRNAWKNRFRSRNFPKDLFYIYLHFASYSRPESDKVLKNKNECKLPILNKKLEIIADAAIPRPIP